MSLVINVEDAIPVSRLLKSRMHICPAATALGCTGRAFRMLMQLRVLTTRDWSYRSECAVVHDDMTKACWLGTIAYWQ